MTNPKLRVRASGYGGSGYAWPFIEGQSLEENRKTVKNSDGEQIEIDTSVKPVIGVTTALKSVAKEALTQWAVDNTAAYAVANIDNLMYKTDEAIYRNLRWYWSRAPKEIDDTVDLRNYHTGVLNDAADLGTTMHEWIEHDLDSTRPEPATEHWNDIFWPMVDAYNEWKDSHFSIVPLGIEQTVWNTKLGYAGTFDLLAEIDGETWLIDVKTSRGLWNEHYMQLAAMAYADTRLIETDKGFTRARFDGLEIDHYGFLHVRPADVNNSGEFIPAYCELVEVFKNDGDLDTFFAGFCSALNLTKSTRQMNAIRESKN